MPATQKSTKAAKSAKSKSRKTAKTARSAGPPKAKLPSMQDLLEAGVHFGHQTRRWNPKMKKYIYTAKAGVHILDLAETRQALAEACKFLAKKAAEEARIVFVTTKRQAAPVISEQAQRAGVFYLNQRWVGGLLTNFSQTKKPIERLNEVLQIQDDLERWGALTTKEQYDLKKEEERLKKLVGGLRGLDKKPQVLVIVDPKREATAVREARQEDVPIVALLDTNADPEVVDYPIPGNDDALKSIKLIITALADAVIKGRRRA